MVFVTSLLTTMWALPLEDSIFGQDLRSQAHFYYTIGFKKNNKNHSSIILLDRSDWHLQSSII